MTVGERIKKIRLEKCMTQKEVAEKCGINDANIRKYESGRQNPKIETVEKIAKALDVPITQLLPYQIKADHNAKSIEDMTEEERKEYMQKSIEDMKKVFKAFEKPLEELQEVKQQLLLSYYDSLNYTGKDEAIKRVEELTEIPKYTKPDNED